jgi:hypothetical protein
LIYNLFGYNYSSGETRLAKDKETSNEFKIGGKKIQEPLIQTRDTNHLPNPETVINDYPKESNKASKASITNRKPLDIEYKKKQI